MSETADVASTGDPVVLPLNEKDSSSISITGPETDSSHVITDALYEDDVSDDETDGELHTDKKHKPRKISERKRVDFARFQARWV